MSARARQARAVTRPACLTAAIVIGLAAVSVSGQLPPPPPPPSAGGETDAQWRQRMEAELADVKRENAELREQVGTVQGVQQSAMKDAESRGIITLEERDGQTTPEFFDLQKYTAEGNFPGSIRLPGTNISIQVGGFTQLDMLFDFDRIGSRDNFIVRTIPTDSPGAGETNFSARQTRLFLKTVTPTD